MRCTSKKPPLTFDGDTIKSVVSGPGETRLNPPLTMAPPRSAGSKRGRDGRARLHGGVPGRRGAARRGAMRHRRRPAGLQPRRPARQGGQRGQGARARRADRHGAGAAGQARSPSTSRPPTCPRKARTSTCRSRWRCWRRWRCCRATRSAAQVALGELSLDGTLVAVIGALPAALAAAEADCGLICPGGLRRRGRLGRRGAGDRAEVRCWRWSTTSPAAPRSPRRSPGTVRRRRVRQGPRRRQGPGEGQARAGDRRGRAAITC